MAIMKGGVIIEEKASQPDQNASILESPNGETSVRIFGFTAAGRLEEMTEAPSDPAEEAER